MAYEQLKSTTLPRVLGDIVSDLGQLVQAEVRLAKTEITSKVGTKVESAIWFAAAGVLGLVVLLLVAQAAVFFLIALGIAGHWSTLIVAAAFLAVALVCLVLAKTLAGRDVTPERTVRQVTKDIQAVKEHLS